MMITLYGLPVCKSLYECSRQDLSQYNHAVKWSEWNKVEATPMLDQTLTVIHNFDHIEVEVKSVASQADAEKSRLSLNSSYRVMSIQS